MEKLLMSPIFYSLVDFALSDVNEYQSNVSGLNKQ